MAFLGNLYKGELHIEATTYLHFSFLFVLLTN